MEYNPAVSTTNYDEAELEATKRMAVRYLAGDSQAGKVFEDECYDRIVSNGLDGKIFALLVTGEWYEADLLLRKSIAPLEA